MCKQIWGRRKKFQNSELFLTCAFWKVCVEINIESYGETNGPKHGSLTMTQVPCSKKKKKNRCTQKLEMELGRIVPVLLPAASTGRYASKWLRNDCCQSETKLKWIQNTRQLKARSSDWALATTSESSDSMLAVLLQILFSDTFPPERFPILRVTYCTCIIFH